MLLGLPYSLYDERIGFYVSGGQGNVAGNRRIFFCWAALAGAGFVAAPRTALGQLGLPDAAARAVPNPLTDPTLNPGKALLFDLEARFARDVLERGGAGFAEWFAEDGVALGNGKAPLVGRVAIQKSANWEPQVYQLTWTPTDAQMGPSGDEGFTWGHYEGHSKDVNGNPLTVTGRYITIWRKQADGSWKVELDAGADEPAEAGDCCKLPPGEH
jgi:ketosteroid isomerase-like protein